jgi:hypothetical protein
LGCSRGEAVSAPADGDGEAGAGPETPVIGAAGTTTGASGVGAVGGGGGSDDEGSAGQVGAGTSDQPRYFAQGIAYEFDHFVAVGVRERGSESAGVVLTSSDGEKWHEAVVEDDAWFRDLVSGNGRLVAIGSRVDLASGVRALSSLDGTSWEGTWVGGVEIGRFGLKAAFGNDLFVVAANHTHLRSADGLSWKQSAPGPSYGGRVAFANGSFVSSTLSETIFVSDGTSEWQSADVTQAAGLPAGYVVDMSVLGGKFAAIVEHDCCAGELPELIRWSTATSENGLAWTKVKEDLEERPPTVVLETEDVCVACLPYDAILSGPDCESLEEVFRFPDLNFQAAVHANGIYLVAGGWDLFRSVDGVNWDAATYRVE